MLLPCLKPCLHAGLRIRGWVLTSFKLSQSEDSADGLRALGSTMPTATMTTTTVMADVKLACDGYNHPASSTTGGRTTTRGPASQRGSSNQCPGHSKHFRGRKLGGRASLRVLRCLRVQA